MIRVRNRVQMAGGYTGLEDQIAVRVRDAVAVVDDGNGSVPSPLESRGHVDTGRPGVAGVPGQLEEGIFHMGDAGGTAAGPLHAGKAGEASAEVPVRTLHGPYLATSLTRLSRITVTLIWPGYSRSVSICLEMS